MTFDPDFGKTGFARRLLRLRFRKLRLSQAEFASRFGLTLGTIKDLEQARFTPTRTMMLLIGAIERDPILMADVAQQERSELERRPVVGHRWGHERRARNNVIP